VRRRDLVILGVTLLVAAAGAVLLLHRLLAPAGIDVDSLVARLDGELASGAVGTARGDLGALRALPRSEGDLLRILRRARAVGSATGDWNPLQSLAARALSLRPGSAALRAVAAYADLRAGRLSDAERTLAHGRLPEDAAAMLRGETALRRGLPWAGADALTRDVLSLRGIEDPAAYSGAALRAGDDRLSLDAALLFMGEGSTEKARLIVEETLGSSPFDDAASAILYDSGDSVGALRRLELVRAMRGDTARIALFSADILQSLGRRGEAEQRLLQSVSLDPEASWTAWADLAYDAAARGDEAAADQRIATGLAHFPHSPELVIARARLALKRGDPGQALVILQPLLKEEPGNVDATLLSLDIVAPSLSPEARRARLWKLYNLNPADPRAFSSLMEALLGVQDWQGASIAIAQREAAGGQPDADLLLIQGVVQGMQGQVAEAVRLFQRAAEARPDGSARYDMALVLLASGNTRGALESLDTAELEYQKAGDPARQAGFASRVLEVRGEALMLEGRSSAARTALTRALAEDPGNLRASLLLRKLEGAGP